MHLDASEAESGHAGLSRAENLALAPQAQIFLGDAEAVFGFAQDFNARLGGFAERRAVKENAGRAFAPASDATTQLMDLRGAKRLGGLDTHQGGSRHIDAPPDTVVATSS